MINYSTQPIFLWDEAIKIAIHILNKISTKATQRTLYELWTGSNWDICIYEDL